MCGHVTDTNPEVAVAWEPGLKQDVGSSLVRCSRSNQNCAQFRLWATKITPRAPAVKQVAILAVRDGKTRSDAAFWWCCDQMRLQYVLVTHVDMFSTSLSWTAA